MFASSRSFRVFAIAAGSLVAAVFTRPGSAQPAASDDAHVFEPGVVSTGHEFTLTFSPDGNRLYFVSTRPTPTSADSSGPDMDIWYAEWTGDDWGDPIHIDAVNSTAKEGSPTVSTEGTICFFSDRNAEANVNSIYCSEMSDATFGDPVRLGPEISSGVSDTSPFLSPDGQTMLFYSTREGGYGEADLYVSLRRDGKWMPAQNLGPVVNTEEWEYNASVSRDGKTLYFGQAGNINAIALEAVGLEGLSAERFVR